MVQESSWKSFTLNFSDKCRGLCRSLPFECLSWSVIELRVYKYIVQALCERYPVDLVESII